jgi:hypothetical protein
MAATAFADAGQQAITPKQFAALSKRVAAVEKSNKAVQGYVANCFNKWVAVSVYGPGGPEGYLYGLADKTVITTSALDITNTGDTPSFFVPAPAADCSLNLTRFRSLAGGARHNSTIDLSRISRTR